MHAELVVPGLFAQPGGAARTPALELLLARGRESASEPRSADRWLLDAFGLDEETLPAGALTLVATGEDPGNGWWARADPVHLRLMRDRLIVVPSAAFSLELDEARALADSLNRHFGARLDLRVAAAQCWCARLDEELAFSAPAPLEAAGRDVDLMLRIGGDAGKRWGALLNEAQMLLHSHPVNEAREARGEPAVNSLWLWGAGRAPRELDGQWQTVSGTNPLALGLGRLAGAQALSIDGAAEEWLSRTRSEGRHLVLIETLRAPLALGEAAAHREGVEALERQWFEPLLAALRASRTAMLTVHVPDAGASFETIRGDLRRFWRRPKALEKYA